VTVGVILVCDKPQFSNLVACAGLRFKRKKSVKILVITIMQQNFAVS